MSFPSHKSIGRLKTTNASLVFQKQVQRRCARKDTVCRRNLPSVLQNLYFPDVRSPCGISEKLEYKMVIIYPGEIITIPRQVLREREKE
ncbi:hypothetical protein AVEN_252348-1 [Araneus ventricosus]|uniref:Uncharacterized protein n=1 Tax=Araneus ventricosus TaxID=182803 RepID=A0A4Y2AQF9_ARAVE|nr:hypothetical protein AVEN_252348-1 [Araneus ventricosus]